jgi:hypothetical protein
VPATLTQALQVKGWTTNTEGFSEEEKRAVQNIMRWCGLRRQPVLGAAALVAGLG